MSPLRRWLRLFSYFSMLLLALLGSRSAAANVPGVVVVNNAPGMNTISWEAPPQSGLILSYMVERQSPPAAWVYEVRAGSHVDLGLQPSTTYKYHVCELNDETECSEWISITTMPAAPVSAAFPEPAFTSYQAGVSDIVLSWTAPRSYDFFQVRRGDRQWETAGGSRGSFSESNLQSNQAYTYIV
ncbi:MAG TPA: fibronectin type III domain-containing protein, partial [Polyangiaceae bacterium]|nr:fibronectin type III domain-containing protein [Polyangiaceae bacterium]